MSGLHTFTLASFDRGRVPHLLATVPLERIRLRRQRGLAWGRHLGTGRGSRTLGVDPARWAWFCSWADEAAAADFHDALEGRLGPAELATLHLRAARAKGRWAGHEVLIAESESVEAPAPLVVLTRARVRPTRWRPFSQSVPGVDADRGRAPGLLRSVGVGEWPVLVQGTLSVWRDAAAMSGFARTEAHRVAVRRTAAERWYAEELFARFALERTQGSWDGTAPAQPGAADPR